MESIIRRPRLYQGDDLAKVRNRIEKWEKCKNKMNLLEFVVFSVKTYVHQSCKGKMEEFNKTLFSMKNAEE